MKTRATTLMIGIGITLGLIVPAAQAAVVLGDAAAGPSSTLTHKASTNYRARTATVGGGAANGEAGKTADQILADSERAAAGARTVHVVGHAVNSGVPLDFNVFLLAGKGGRGQVVANGLSFKVVRFGRSAYFEGSTAFWRHFGQMAGTLLNGRWIEAPATQGEFASFTSLTDLAGFVKGALGSHGVLKVGTLATVDGQRVIPLIDTTYGGTVFVAATGRPFPLGLIGETGSIIFEGWNEAVTLAAPAHAIPYSEFTTHG